MAEAAGAIDSRKPLFPTETAVATAAQNMVCEVQALKQMNILFTVLCAVSLSIPQWGGAYTEMKVPSGENTA